MYILLFLSILSNTVSLFSPSRSYFRFSSTPHPVSQNFMRSYKRQNITFLYYFQISSQTSCHLRCLSFSNFNYCNCSAPAPPPPPPLPSQHIHSAPLPFAFLTSVKTQPTTCKDLGLKNRLSTFDSPKIKITYC